MPGEFTERTDYDWQSVNGVEISSLDNLHFKVAAHQWRQGL